jgi:hypothetical protein
MQDLGSTAYNIGSFTKPPGSHDSRYPEVQSTEGEVEEQDAQSEKVVSDGIRLGDPKGCS